MIKILFVILFLLVSIEGLAQGSRQYSYHFENARFDISSVDIKITDTGDGTLKFKKRDEEEETSLTLKMTTETVKKLQNFYDELRFLDTADNYQANAQMANLGTTTLGLNSGERKRSASFNYSDNKSVMQLVAFYRAIENQYRRLEEIKLARQFAPLDLPKQLKILEEDLKRNRIAEPSQIVPILSDISVDDAAPLIARNAAGKLVAQIKRSK
jgi:hypothetical protein